MRVLAVLACGESGGKRGVEGCDVGGEESAVDRPTRGKRAAWIVLLELHSNQAHPAPCRLRASSSACSTRGRSSACRWHICGC